MTTKRVVYAWRTRGAGNNPALVASSVVVPDQAAMNYFNNNGEQ
ncbi:MAG TPA: hypothetical protein VK201_10375 [bacterium]|nr:hypothetical protein [bacterium]